MSPTRERWLLLRIRARSASQWISYGFALIGPKTPDKRSAAVRAVRRTGLLARYLVPKTLLPNRRIGFVSDTSVQRNKNHAYLDSAEADQLRNRNLQDLRA